MAATLFLGGAVAQSVGAGTIQGSVVDPSGAAIPKATILLSNPLRQFERAVIADAHGNFDIENVPLDSYQLIVRAPKFTTSIQEVNVAGTVPLRIQTKLALAGTNQTVSVEAAGAIVQTVSPSAHTNVDEAMISAMPQRSPGSGLSDLITDTSPSVAADSNGFFHPLGDHAQQTFVVDGQPDSDQQSKLFSTSIPANAIQSLDLITAAPSAEYGDKTSMVVDATTRSGLGSARPHGDLETYYGAFGTAGENGTLSFGSAKFGNFTAVDSERSGRFLDTPELFPLHDVGTNIVVFNRFDYQPNNANTFHLDVFGARNNFAIPNTFDQQATSQDQRQRVLSFNISPSWQHIFGPHAVLTANPWVRRDQVDYTPSSNQFADQPATMGQSRFLTNWGGKLNLAFNGGGQNLTAGTQIMQTRLEEQFQLGLTDPLFNAVCVDGNGNPIVAPGVNDPNNCGAAGARDAANPAFRPGLLPFDLTRSGTLFQFHGSKNIDEYAVYGQDAVQLGDFTFAAGAREDRYVGLVTYSGFQPRIGGSYRIRKTASVFRASVSRSYESPYNE
ncbi:MAG TPA: TonB-dependent receptor, partial [Terriglobales bacterium]